MSVLLVSQRDGVATLTLNRPDVRNALDRELFGALNDTLAQVAEDPEVRCVVLTGAGKAFCAGGDIRAMMEREGKGAETARYVTRTVAGVVESLVGMEKPVVAKVNGDAFGAGMSLVAACDLAYASAESRFGAAFARIGLIPDTGGTWTLPRKVGLAAAKELLFFAQTWTAEQARAKGLVNEVVAPAELDKFVQERAQRLADGPTLTLGLQKRSLHYAQTVDVKAALAFEANVQGLCFTTDEHKEGRTAFLEKREPRFRK